MGKKNRSKKRQRDHKIFVPHHGRLSGRYESAKGSVESRIFSKPTSTDPAVHIKSRQHPAATPSSAAFHVVTKRPIAPALTKAQPAFGSAASRRRELPVVTFVYSRTGNSPLQYYCFGKHDDAAAVNHNKSQQPDILSHPGESKMCGDETTISKAKQSIDEILYPKQNGIVHDTPATLEIDAFVRHDPTQENSNQFKTSDKCKILLSSSDEKAQVECNAIQNSSILSRDHTELTAGTDVIRSSYLSGVSVEEAIRDKHGLRPRSNSTDGELSLPQRGLCDERQVLETYRWNHDTIKLRPRGFDNLGNTCFLNSTLQVLAYCPPFCQSIMSMHKDKLKNCNQNGKNHGKRITLMIGSLFRQLHRTVGSKSDNTNGMCANSPIAPRDIVNAIPMIGHCGSRNRFKFHPGRQEDAHEFLVYLLDAMNDGELKEAGINAHKSGWRDRLPVPRLDETTFVHRIFGGYLRSQVQCTNCNYRSNTYDPFFDLSLEISRKSCHSVCAAIQQFTRKETLDNENRWKCSGCRKRVCATKQLTVFRPPLALFIQLKRFSFGSSLFHGGRGTFGGGIGGKKILKPIEFQSQMKLPLSDGRSCEYALTGIVIHVGESASSGHYTAYVKNTIKHGVDRWFHMDDTFVQAVTDRVVLRQRDAYVLLYCRKEVKLEFPVPPLRAFPSAEEAIAANRARVRARSESLTDFNEKGHAPLLDIEASKNQKLSTDSIVVKTKALEHASGIDATSSLISAEISTITPPVAPVKNSHKKNCVEPIKSNNDFMTLNPRTSLQPCDIAIKAKSNTSHIDSKLNEGSNIAEHSTSSSEQSSATSSDSSSDSESSRNESVLESENASIKVEAFKVDLKNTRKESPCIKRIIRDNGENGKVEVVLGSRFNEKKAWKPILVGDSRGDGRLALLGNALTSRWDDDSDSSEKLKASFQSREIISKQVERAERDRKRLLQMDRHDSLLDQGKVCL